MRDADRAAVDRAQVDATIATIESRPFQAPVSLRRAPNGSATLADQPSLPLSEADPNSGQVGAYDDGFGPPPIVPLDPNAQGRATNPGNLAQGRQNAQPGLSPNGQVPLVGGQRVDPRTLGANPLIQNLLRRMGTPGGTVAAGQTNALPLVGIPRTPPGDANSPPAPGPLVGRIAAASVVGGAAAANPVNTPFVLNPSIPSGVRRAISEFQANGGIPVTTRIEDVPTIVATGSVGIRGAEGVGVRPQLSVASSNGGAPATGVGNAVAPVPNPAAMPGQPVAQVDSVRGTQVGGSRGGSPRTDSGQPDFAGDVASGGRPISSTVNLLTANAVGQVER